MKKIAPFLLLFVTTQIAFSQTQHFNIPTNFQKAYKNKTRSFDGSPGINYWQNKSEYKISAKLDPATKILAGVEAIKYYNESPDTLKQIVLRLYPDFYKKGNQRDFPVVQEALTDGTEIKKVSVNGKELKLEGDKYSPVRDGTNLFLQLESKLPPGQNIELNLEWSFFIPAKSQVRMGAYDSTSLFVAYWYPQIAVYDDIDGWDTQNYTGQTEMYNDFNNYEVDLTVPKGFLLWSTGVLQNPEEVFSKNILDKYKLAMQSDNIINVVDSSDLSMGSVTGGKENITYKIKALYVPDFVFATSDHYLWDASSLIVDKETGRRSFISAVYSRSTKDFLNVAGIARKSIESFSTHLPGVPYPYPAMTVFNGQGGMEFPMMCNNSAVANLQGTVHLTSHEICHTYFPFYMGINERKYAWMDEGWATMLPFDFQTENAPGYDPRTRNSQSYSEFAGLDTDIPLMVPSHQLRGPSYRTASYRRPGAAYEFLRQMLGEDKFLSALKTYMKRWNGKHPAPYDFFFSFNEFTGEDLSWYWKPWFFENYYPDLAIKNFKQQNGRVRCEIKNIGGLPLPVILKVFYSDGTSEIVFSKTVSVWKNSTGSVSVYFRLKKKIIKVELGSTQIPDVDISNNTLEL